MISILILISIHCIGAIGILLEESYKGIVWLNYGCEDTKIIRWKQ